MTLKIPTPQDLGSECLAHSRLLHTNVDVELSATRRHQIISMKIIPSTESIAV